MKLWMLEPNPTRCGLDRWDSMTTREREAARRADPWRACDDAASQASLGAPVAMVIRAASEEEARRMAYEASDPFREDVAKAWLSPELTLFAELRPEGEAEVLLVERMEL
jgi:hypothetical protein